jgi:hypothetical protein
MSNIFEKFFGGKDKEVAKEEKVVPIMTQERLTQVEKDEYTKAHPEEVYTPGDIGKYRMREDNIAVNEARKENPGKEINDVSQLSEEQLPETFIDKNIREKEEQAATEELREKIKNTYK